VGASCLHPGSVGSLTGGLLEVGRRGSALSAPRFRRVTAWLTVPRVDVEGLAESCGARRSGTCRPAIGLCASSAAVSDRPHVPVPECFSVG